MTYTEEHKNEKMTAKDWNDVDASSRLLAKMWLSQNEFFDVKESEGCCCYDLLASRIVNGTKKTYAIECKNRSADKYDKFKDVMVEMIKLDSLKARKAKGEFNGIILINTYTNSNIVRYANGCKEPDEVKCFRCPKWSYVKGVDSRSEDKSCALFKQFNESVI